MKFKTVNDICSLVRGSSPRPSGDPRYYGGNIPRLMVTDVTRDGMYVTPQIAFLTIEGASKSRPMQKGDVVIAVSGDPGEPCILKVDACIHDGFVGLRDLKTDIVFPPYLYRYFKFNKLNNKSQAVGAIYKNLNTDQIKALNIPLPPLETQKKIAAILDAADAYRQKTKALIAKYEELTQSVFLEMFGDPGENKRMFDSRTINDVALEVTDGDHATPKRADKGYKLLSCRNVKQGHIDFTTGVDYVEKDEFDRMFKRCNPEKGDILISCSGTIGRTTEIKIDEPFVLVRSAALIKLKRELLNPTYMEYYLRTSYMQAVMQRKSNSSGQANLFTGSIKALPVLIPEMNLQNQFATRVQKIETQKAQAQQSLEKAEELFNSLLQRAFKGELV